MRYSPTAPRGWMWLKVEFTVRYPSPQSRTQIYRRPCKNRFRIVVTRDETLLISICIQMSNTSVCPAFHLIQPSHLIVYIFCTDREKNPTMTYFEILLHITLFIKKENTAVQIFLSQLVPAYPRFQSNDPTKCVTNLN